MLQGGAMLLGSGAGVVVVGEEDGNIIVGVLW